MYISIEKWNCSEIYSKFWKLRTLLSNYRICRMPNPRLFDSILFAQNNIKVCRESFSFNLLCKRRVVVTERILSWPINIQFLPTISYTAFQKLLLVPNTNSSDDYFRWFSDNLLISDMTIYKRYLSGALVSLIVGRNCKPFLRILLPNVEKFHM